MLAPPVVVEDDIKHIMNMYGFNDDNMFLDTEPLNLLQELGRNFVEELFDTFRYKKRELVPGDIKKAVAIKFPEHGLISDLVLESGAVQANRIK